jgi:biotin synthase
MKEDFEKIIHIDKPTIEKKLLARGENQEKLFELARYVRDNGIFKNRVELRSVIEISNHCRQACRYCGIGKHGSEFYILNHQEILKDYLIGIDRAQNIPFAVRRIP